ncbi:MAG TPA: UbiA family prenyltransferase [Balneolaceae bacterium]
MKIPKSIVIQIWHFFLHLRWHYQLFILSGGFLLGGFLSNGMNTFQFSIQFLNVHLLLFGGATAYNSYWDKDEGPIGGLKNPPQMTSWMLPASVVIQLSGLLFAFKAGALFTVIYLISMLFFWLYSSPVARWKGHPIKSLFAIGISTGCNSVLMGYLAAGNNLPDFIVLMAAVGVTLILLSLYPVSQIYQRDEDEKRGDQTFAIRYGTLTVKRFFERSFFSGLFITASSMALHHALTGILFGVVGSIAGLIIRFQLKKLGHEKESYIRVMNIKYGTSLAFVSFLMIALLLKYF